MGGRDAETLTKISEVCFKLCDYQGALVYAQRALEVRLAKDAADPCNALQVLLGRILYASGQQDTAIQIFTNVLQKDEHDCDALREYAKVSGALPWRPMPPLHMYPSTGFPFFV